MNNVTKQDVIQLQGRVEEMYLPIDINSKLSIVLLVSGIILFFPTFSLILGQLPIEPWFQMYYFISCVLFVIQLAITLFFRKLSWATRLHRFQITWLMVAYMKFTIDAYLMYYFIVLNEQLETWAILAGITAQILGLLLMLRLMITSNNLVLKGNFKQHGRGMNFHREKINFGLLLIGGVSGIIMILISFGHTILLDNEASAFLPLGFCITIQYLVSLVMPELYLIYKYRKLLTSARLI